MKRLQRLLKHLFTTRWQVAQYFPRPTMAAIAAAIRHSESQHMGELRVVIEAALDMPALMADQSARDRAVEIFSRLRVWDTEHNSGVLIYLLLAEHKLEIVADRGIHARVGSAAWEAICRDMEQQFRAGRFEAGMLQGIAAINDLLQQHFPAHGRKLNELPDQPAVL